MQIIPLLPTVFKNIFKPLSSEQSKTEVESGAINTQILYFCQNPLISNLDVTAYNKDFFATSAVGLIQRQSIQRNQVFTMEEEAKKHAFGKGLMVIFAVEIPKNFILSEQPLRLDNSKILSSENIKGIYFNKKDDNKFNTFIENPDFRSTLTAEAEQVISHSRSICTIG